MNIPGELVIFGRTYTIKPMEHIHSSEGTLGIAAYRDGNIHIDLEVDPTLILKVLWHEAFHIAQQEITQECDEAQARWVSLFIHNFLIDNPMILECYLEELDKHYEQAITEEEASPCHCTVQKSPGND
jgi:hypothetical protein